MAEHEDLARKMMEILPVIYRSVFSLQREPGRLAPAQIRALLALEAAGPCSMTQLAEAAGISKQQLTGVVDTLVVLALARRQTLPGNRRQLTVEISAKGHRLLGKAVEDRAQALADLLKTMNAQEIQLIHQAFEVLGTHLQCAVLEQASGER